jgi:hypothetical protein
MHDRKSFKKFELTKQKQFAKIFKTKGGYNTLTKSKQIREVTNYEQE